MLRFMGYRDPARALTETDDPAVAHRSDDFEAGDGPRSEKTNDRVPVVRRPVGKREQDFRGGRDTGRASSKFTWWAMVEVLERFIEPAHAAKAAGEGHLDHREIRLVDQLLGQQDTTCLCDRNGSSANRPAKEPAKLPLPNFKP